MKRLATSIRKFANSPIRQLPRLALILAAALVPSLSSATGVVIAAVPLRWTVETSRAQPAVFEAYHGESLDLAATLQSYGKPVEIDPQAEWHIYWQTNGMADAWWSAPVPPPVPGRTAERSETAEGRVVTATFTPAMDPGAPAVNGFIGSPGNNYRAAFTIRFRHAPGALPNALPLPTPVIDFAKVRVLNPPWGSGGGGGCDTNTVDILANSAVVTNALTVATTNRVALLESSKADKADISATDPTFSNAVMEVTQDFKTNTYTKTETDALIAANKPEYEDVPSNVVWRIEAEGGRFFFKPVRPIHTED